MENQELIEYLVRKQVKLGWTDDKMAKRLHCSRALWQQTRTGSIPLGLTVLSGVASAFPETGKKVIYVLDGLCIERKTVGDITGSPDKLYNGKLARLNAMAEGLYLYVRKLFG